MSRRYEAEVYSKGEEKVFKLKIYDLTIGDAEALVKEQIITKEQLEQEKADIQSTAQTRIDDIDAKLAAITTAELTVEPI